MSADFEIGNTLRTPVAFLIFNRPETTALVFTEIAKARPAKLLVVADGPRPDHPEDVEKCAATRAIIDRVDWDCEVLRNFADKNLGCKVRVSGGIDWVFSEVEEAIILEDDCLPHPSFFPFCAELLERYREDERVMTISGLNLLGEWKSGNQSYFFSCLGGTWGWATWRRAWRHFDREIKSWPKARDLRTVENLFPKPRQSSFWKDVFQKVYDGKIDTWDYQWLLAGWLQGAWGIAPHVNLVRNIGFGAGATHHQFEDDPLANLPIEEMAFPLKHPSLMARNLALDDALSEAYYSVKVDSISTRLKRKVGKLLVAGKG
ncbi:MAG: hypothetical protein QOD75_1796 [Blastocatellia bacterium]|jgi:hypothetical protein|nr:hypothetical protein [Blastocatellia bacterium]